MEYMRATALQIIDCLRERSYTVGELSDAIDKSQSWTSEVVSDLIDEHLVERADKIQLASTYEATLLVELLEQYDLTKILTGTKEEVLSSLLSVPQTVSELQQAGFAKSTLYNHLNEIQETGVITKSDEGYIITDDTLQSFLEARIQHDPFETTYRANGDRLIVTSTDNIDGMQTAFSAFTRYGVEYHAAKTYSYQGETSLTLEAVLLHAVRVAETKQQMAMAGVFYLTHRGTLDSSDCWRLANKWDCVETWADLLAYIDQREVQQEELFLPWGEFMDLATDYDVYPRGQHPEDSLETGLKELGATLETPVDVYLLGGGNLILRGLKDSTKDIDLVVETTQTFRLIAEALQEEGYDERRELETAYAQLDPSIVLEQEGFPRWDIFVEAVAGQLRLTDSMIERCDQSLTYDNLNVHLLSPSDIFLFKSITEREGDLEDVVLLTKQTDLNWGVIFDEIKTQEELTNQLFSFVVLDTLDILDNRHDIVAPIKDKLVSYCLENALLVSLKAPKTIEDLREELDFADHRIYNRLRKLEAEDEIAVDRTGRLNTYHRIEMGENLN